MLDREKTVLSSLPLSEDDSDDTTEDIVQKNYQILDLQNLIDVIGKKEFKNLWAMSKNEIMWSFPLPLQAKFCRDIIVRMSVVYNYEFLQKIDLEFPDGIAEFYELLEYIEYKYIEFFIYLMKKYSTETLTADILDKEVPIALIPHQFKLFLLSQHKELLKENLRMMMDKYWEDIRLHLKIEELQ